MYKYACNVGKCRKSCTSHYNLKLHIEGIHGRKITLTECLALYKFVEDESKASNPIHRETVRCEYCYADDIEVKFQGNGNLNKHIKKFHPGEALRARKKREPRSATRSDDAALSTPMVIVHTYCDSAVGKSTGRKRSQFGMKTRSGKFPRNITATCVQDTQQKP